jgi:hypothetical protein
VLKHTVLRHKMLADIAAGYIHRARWGSRTWDIASKASTYGAMEKAVEHLIHGGAARIERSGGDPYGRPVVTTEVGDTVLSEWNDKHGEPTAR